MCYIVSKYIFIHTYVKAKLSAHYILYKNALSTLTCILTIFLLLFFFLFSLTSCYVGKSLALHLLCPTLSSFKCTILLPQPTEC